jgi:hypothetical protein
MSFLELAPPDWNALPGGDAEEASWLGARARKLAFAAESVKTVGDTASNLNRRDALFHSTPEVLLEVPHAARFYLDLLGLTRKTLNIMYERVVRFGLSVSPETIATNLLEGRNVSARNLAAFSAFVNEELDAIYPEESRTADLAVGTVLTIVGARIHGRVQNMAGDDAVVLLKGLLVAAMETQGVGVEVLTEAGKWIAFDPVLNLLKHTRLRFGGRLICEFIPGGNRPDIKILLNGVTLAVGEVKGRKDMSNLWESWMPQIAGHLRTWTVEHPDAPRLFFGTIITDEMIEGVTAAGTHHAGLKVLQKNGLLTAAYNLSLTAGGDAAATAAFSTFCNQLQDLI